MPPAFPIKFSCRSCSRIDTDARSPFGRQRWDKVEAALRNSCSSLVIDGEAVLLGVDGRPDFDGLHSHKHNDEVQFYAFDIMAADGEDVRKLPLSMRKTNLSRLFARRVDGIFLSDFEQGEIGPDLFRHACLLGLEGSERSRGWSLLSPAADPLRAKR